MIDPEEILTTLRSRLLEFSDVDRNNVTWMNIPFKPDPAAGYYVREHLTITLMRQIANGYQKAAGIYHLDVFVPTGSGTKTPLAIARSIAMAFDYPQEIVGPITVMIDRTEILSGRAIGDAYFGYPVQSRWRAHRAT